MLAKNSNKVSVEPNASETSQNIKFQGNLISVNFSSFPYFEVKSEQDELQCKNFQELLDFLNVNIDSYKASNAKGSIIVADDQFVNLQGIRLNFMDIGLEERLELFSNGGDTLNFFKELFQQIKD